ncbi:helix-turn-helix domain-containing protein [Olsenella profusa]|nr:helix-turn-helix transcriptional regulator [Olsenella profusa]
MKEIETLEGYVAARCAERGTKRKDLAALLGISSTWTLRRKLRGESPLYLKESKRLADYLGITVEELIDSFLDSAPDDGTVGEGGGYDT